VQVGAARALAVVAYHSVDKPLRTLGSSRWTRKRATAPNGLASDANVNPAIDQQEFAPGAPS
jgi:hypothetical protein